jgi:hypothetical protein
LETALNKVETQTRISLSGNEESRAKVVTIPAELRWASKAMHSAASINLKKINADRPNPQINLAAYVLDWIKAATGRAHFEEFTTLVHAAFLNAGEAIPRWTERLPLEMNLKRRTRQRWASTLEVRRN